MRHGKLLIHALHQWEGKPGVYIAETLNKLGKDCVLLQVVDSTNVEEAVRCGRMTVKVTPTAIYAQSKTREKKA